MICHLEAQEQHFELLLLLVVVFMYYTAPVHLYICRDVTEDHSGFTNYHFMHFLNESVQAERRRCSHKDLQDAAAHMNPAVVLIVDVHPCTDAT